MKLNYILLFRFLLVSCASPPAHEITLPVSTWGGTYHFSYPTTINQNSIQTKDVTIAVVEATYKDEESDLKIPY